VGRACTVCFHPANISIDAALKTNRSLRDIAAQFGISKTALHRHWRAHTSAEPAPQPAENGTSPEIAATKRRPGILKWIIVGGIGVIAGWRIRGAIKG
jgi:hypothetical protein